MRKILFISHFFPPCGGAGVQRTSKFVKYLPDEGFMPVVLTGKVRGDDKWSPEDSTLLADLPENLVVYRADWNSEEPNTKTRHRQRRDALIGMGSKAIQIHKPELILVTMSPFQDAEIAYALSKKYEIPWIADLRDPWALDEFQVRRTFIHFHYEQKRMRRSLSTASGIIMNTPEAERNLLTVFPEFEEKMVISITNGYDPDDFPERKAGDRRKKFRIVHTGSFHTSMGLHQSSNDICYRLLRRCKGGMEILPRSPFFLLKAIDIICKQVPDMKEKLEVVFAGVTSRSDMELIERSGVKSLVTITGYLGHNESASHTAEADLLFLPLHSLRKGHRASIVPGKTYEYIASGNPILAALPDGDAKDYIRRCGNNWIVGPKDINGLAQGILHFFKQWETGTLSHDRDPECMKEFDRRYLTRKLSDFLTEVSKSGAQ